MTVLWMVLLGFVVGLALGALGGGGAILTVPILVYLGHQTPQAATAGSLVIVGLSALVGMLTHGRSGRVRYVEGIVFGLLGIGGSLVGARLSVRVPGEILMLLFAVLMLVVAALLIRKERRQAATQSDQSGEAGEPVFQLKPLRIRPAGAVRLVVAATGVGLLTGFFGVGGGFAVVPALILVMGFSMQTAVGTSLLVIVINSVTALAGRLGGGLELDWTLIGPFALTAAAGTIAGGRLAQRLPARRLTQAFIVMLVVVAVGVGAANIGALV